MTRSLRDALATAIRDAGWMTSPPADPSDVADFVRLLTTLYEIGRRDLPLGRLLEGHADAVQIIRRYADREQCSAFERRLAEGAILGVWNAAWPANPLVLRGDALSGGKSFASGAGLLTHALVTADTREGAQLVLVDLSEHPPEIDRSWWRTIGMQGSQTHRVSWSARPVAPSAVIGRPGDYSREPFFSGGALRFVAVHAGGVAGLLDMVTTDLVARGRAEDAIQRTRLSALYEHAEASAGAVRRAAEGWFEHPDQRLARIAGARSIVSRAADRALVTAQQAVGLEGMFVDHPLAAQLTDLAVYLRQPAPDAVRARVGEALADRSLTVRL